MYLEVCKTFIRRFDPAPRLQPIESHTMRVAAAWRSFDERFRIYQYVLKQDRARIEHADHTNPTVRRTSVIEQGI